MSQHTITVIPSKTKTIEFKVDIEDVVNEDKMKVRLVIQDVDHGGSWLLNCVKGKQKHVWEATIPPTTGLQKEEYSYTIELIADDYFFEPDSGIIKIGSEPKVTVSPSKSKPTVSVKTQTTEAAVVQEDRVEITNASSPNTKLLTFEFNPSSPQQTGDEVPAAATQQTGDDEQVDVSVIDPRSAEVPSDAERVDTMLTRLQRIKKPDTAGFLFNKNSAGRTVVKGLETRADLAQQAAKDDKVTQILRQLNY